MLVKPLPDRNMAGSRFASMRNRLGLSTLRFVLMAAALTVALSACSGGEDPSVQSGEVDWVAVVQDGSIKVVDPNDGRDGPLSSRPSDSAAIWSADGETLAFIHDGDIYTSLVEGRPSRKVSYAGTGVQARNPQWSQSADDIAYELAGADPGVAILNPSSGSADVVYRGPALLVGWWSHPGLAFEHLVLRDPQTNSVFAVDRFGGEAKHLLSGDARATHPQDGRILVVDDREVKIWSAPDSFEAVTSLTGAEPQATWSADGEWIIAWTTDEFLVLPAAGGPSRSVTVSGSHPTLSPDGQALALESGDQIVVVDLESGDIRELTSGLLPSWKPRGVLPAAASSSPPIIVRTAPILAEPAPRASTTAPPAAASVQDAFPQLTVPLDQNAFPRFLDLVYLGDGVDRFYAVSKQGWIATFPNDPATTTVAVVLEIPARINVGREGGLLGLAFDPNFRMNGYFYVFYTVGGIYDGEPAAEPEGPRRNVVSRFSMVEGRLDIADPDSELVLIEIFPPVPEPNQHNAGQLAFGPDGYLYIGTGDGLTPESAQDLGALTGAILRIDVSASTTDSPYLVPQDNPFIGVQGVREEIWAYGLRNPWRFSFDDITGQLWVADVGGNDAEEVNLVERGVNYGWPVIEGATILDEELCAQYDCEGMVQPIWDYSRDNIGITNVEDLQPRQVLPSGVPCVAIIGGFVYHGSALPELQGDYLFSDHCVGGVWALRSYDDGTIEVFKIADRPEGQGNVTALVEGPRREPYLLDNNTQRIWLVVPGR